MMNQADDKRIRAGTSGWGYKEWRGSFYPEKFREGDMLRFYGDHFPTVEVNYTARRMPKPELLENWATQVPLDFSFLLKAPQQITHFRRLKNIEDPLAHFAQVVMSLGIRLGPVVFQLPPNFKKDVPLLTDFLAQLPTGLRAAFEFRHETWYDDQVYNALRSREVALCIADTDDATSPLLATAPWGYVRLRRESYSEAELQTWLERIRAFNWPEVYVFFKHEDDARGPAFATRFLHHIAETAADSLAGPSVDTPEPRAEPAIAAV
jgi:uncharacterized protein YecE (DUF72 family)